MIDSIYLHTKRRNHMPHDLWPLVQAQVECAARNWQEPDQGIWEARGEPKHYTSSKLMCWVAMDRGARLAEIYGDPELAASWQSTADEIRDEILDQGRQRARCLQAALRDRCAGRLAAADADRALPAA